jgi:hypothetical protein
MKKESVLPGRLAGLFLVSALVVSKGCTVYPDLQTCKAACTQEGRVCVETPPGSSDFTCFDCGRADVKNKYPEICG